MLQAVLEPVLQQVASENICIEVDPDKLSGGEVELMVTKYKLLLTIRSINKN